MARFAALIVAAAMFLGGAAAALAAAPPQVSVFPSPGSKAALPGTQITFRGIPAASIGTIQVVGSTSGAHTGTIAADSDGNGGSFLPAAAFAPGETVTVSTSLNILGSTNGTFRFKVATPTGPIYGENIPLATGANDRQYFVSRPDLQPPAITVTQNSAPAADGDIFVAPQLGPVADGPMLLDPSGKLIWFDPMPKNTLVTDFRVQQLGGQPVLTWWQGSTSLGSGRGVGVILNQHYQQIAVINAGNGVQGADLHEFLVTPQGDAYLIVASPIRWPGLSRPLMDSVVQEIDIKTGLVLFEWHAADHIPLSASYFKSSSRGGRIYDPFHANSIAIASDGNLIVSLRNTWGIYKIDHRSGAVLWTLGSNRSSFKLAPGVAMAFQHDALIQPDGTLTVFDDGAGPPTIEPQSRGMRIRLDTKAMTATLVSQYLHSPAISSNYEGNVQVLPSGNLFVGWGQQPYFTEFSPSGRQIFDAHFNTRTDSYRAYRFPWNGQPLTNPDVGVRSSAGGTNTVYASWNGATSVASWRVLAGLGPAALVPVATARRQGFETAVPLHTEEPYYQVQALGFSGQVLSTSAAVSPGPIRVSIFGRTAFAPPGGFSGLYVGCFASLAVQYPIPGTTPCHVSTTITSGSTVLAQTGNERIRPNSGGLVFFSLNRTGRALLARAKGHRLPVTATIRDASGATSAAAITLVPYATGGRGPRYTARQSPVLPVYSHTAFVNPEGVGGVFAGCFASQPCHVTVTLNSGRTVLAHSGSEFIGADDCGNVFFVLSPAARSALAHAPGNILPARITISDGRHSSAATISLVRFS